MTTQQNKHRDMQGVAVWWWNATIKSLYAVDCKDDNIEHIFDLYCEQANGHFFVHIAREWAYIHGTKVNHCEDARDSCEGMGMMAHHATIKSFICCQSKWWWQTSSCCKKRWQWAYLQCCIAREAMTVIVLMLWEAVVLQGSERHDYTIARRKDATIKHYTCCWLQGWQRQALSTARMIATCVPCVILQGAMTTNNGWLQQRNACQATTNQTLCCIAGANDDRGTRTLSMRWSHPTLCCKRPQRQRQQLITTSVRDRKSDNQPYSSMWISHINDCKGARCQQWDWSWCHDDNVDNTTIISMSYC